MKKNNKEIRISPEIDNTEQIVETIHDKYREFIIQANNGYLRGFEYPMAMEILRWCESKTGHQIPLNMGCGACLIDLIKLFSRLEK